MSKNKYTTKLEKPASTPKRNVLPKRIVAPPRHDMGIWRWTGIVAAMLGVLLYLNTLGHQYCLDDYSLIKENIITKKGISGIPEIFTTEYRKGAWNSPGSLYRPLTSSTFAIEWHFFPDRPSVGHLVNVILYGLTGWLLWSTWRRVFGSYPAWFTALATLMFIAHPIHTEVVANIKSRDEILALIFATLALKYLWDYVHSDKTFKMLLAVFFYGVSLFCKESSITFLALFPLTLYFFANISLGKILRVSSLFLIPAVIYLGIRHTILSAQNGVEVYSILDNFMVEASKPSQLASAFMMCGKYLYTLFVPAVLVSEQGYPQLQPITFTNWRAIVSFLVYTGMLVWALMKLKDKHFLSFAILFYLISFSLFSNVVMQIGTSYGERLMYLPSLGIVFMICYGLLYLSNLGKIKDAQALKAGSVPIHVLLFGLVILLSYSVRTYKRNPAWKDSYALYSSDIVNAPNSAKLNYHFGLEWNNRGLDNEKVNVVDSTMTLKAIETYNKAISLYPKYHDAYAARGLAHFRLQHYDQAFEDYQKSLTYRPNDPKVLSNMGYIYFLRNDLATSEKIYREALQMDPQFADAHRNLGTVYALSKKFPEAIKQWEEGLKYAPDNATIWFYIGSAYRDMGQPEKSAPYFDKAVLYDPRFGARIKALTQPATK